MQNGNGEITLKLGRVEAAALKALARDENTSATMLLRILIAKHAKKRWGNKSPIDWGYKTVIVQRTNA